jgi:DNA-binding response OmpR family regulator
MQISTPSVSRTGVLLVEDDADSREILALALRMAGFTVYEASDAASAVIQVQEHEPAVIVTDLRLLDTQGVTVVQTLRQASLRPPVPIMVLTGSALEDTETHARLAGAQAVLRKPYDLVALVTVIQRLLESTPQAVSP